MLFGWILVSSIIVYVILLDTVTSQEKSCIEWRESWDQKKCREENAWVWIVEFEEVKHIVEVRTASECRAICCNLGDKCITWQYELYSKQCEFGPVMRLGTEAAGCGWLVWITCTSEVEWSKSWKSQCWWDGDVEYRGFDYSMLWLRSWTTSDYRTMSTNQQACAADKECGIWQEFPGWGCFYNANKGIFCDEKKPAKYGGVRKSITNYCG